MASNTVSETLQSFRVYPYPLCPWRFTSSHPFMLVLLWNASHLLCSEICRSFSLIFGSVFLEPPIVEAYLLCYKSSFPAYYLVIHFVLFRLTETTSLSFCMFIFLSLTSLFSNLFNLNFLLVCAVRKFTVVSIPSRIAFSSFNSV